MIDEREGGRKGGRRKEEGVDVLKKNKNPTLRMWGKIYIVKHVVEKYANLNIFIPKGSHQIKYIHEPAKKI